jgi:diguanylate cyclase (GGDEF)-like protein/PAS domain S-box-containing protein
MHPNRATVARFARNGMEPLLALIAVAGLRLFGLSGDSPLWIIAVILLASTVYQQPEVQRRLARGNLERSLWARAGLHVLCVTAVMYLTGWGSLLAIAHLHVLSLYLKESGSRAWRPVATASVISIALGELSLATGLIHGYLPEPQVHGIALLVALGVVTTARVMAQTVRQAEIAEVALRGSEERFRALVRDGGDVIFLTEANASVTYVSPAARSVMGYEPDALLGDTLRDLFHPEDRLAVLELHARLLAGDDSIEHTLEVRVLHADQQWHWHEVIVRNMLANPAVGAIIAHHRDITERRTVQDQVAHAATHDSLTGLANGPTLIRDLELALHQGTRYQHPVGMLFLDVDGFKAVNDTYGHEVGDRLLRTISEVIARNTRDTDVVGRLGGDEFGVVLTRVNGPDEARSVAARIIAGIVNNASVAGLKLDVGCSVGVALAYPGGTDAKTLLRHADEAMYHSKRRGRNGCELYTQEEVNAPWL